MFFSQPTNELFQALPLLEKFETKSAKGAMAIPSIVINRIYILLEEATAKGDCVAPFFLDYMHRQGYNQGNRKNLPNLALVPTHRAEGPKWVKAYELYLKVVSLYESLPKSIPILAITIDINGDYKFQSLTMMFIKQQKGIANLITEFEALNLPIATLLVAKFLLRVNRNTANIEILFEKPGLRHNVWAIQEYGMYLIERDLFNPHNPQHARLRQDWSILTTSDFETLAKQYNPLTDTDSITRWQINSYVHGEKNLVFRIIDSYVTGKVLDPTPPQDAFAEAIKWLNWCMHCHGENAEFRLLFMTYLRKHLLSHEPQSLHRNLFTLHMVEFLFSHDMSDAYPTDRSVDMLINVLNEEINRVCLVVYQIDPEIRILKENSIFSARLALSMELQGNHKTAEKWHRNTLRLMPDYPTAQYHLANILEMQNKSPDESNALFLQAALNGCENSFKRLLRRVFIHNDLSSQQIAQCIQIAQNNQIKTMQCTSDNETQSIPLVTWLHNIYEYKVYKNNFKLWKNSTKQFVDQETRIKEAFFNEASATLLQHQPKDIVPPNIPSTDSIDIESDTEEELLSEEVTTTVQQEQIPDEDIAVKRAVRTLAELQNKPMRNLTIRDRVRVEQCFEIIMKCSTLQISTKGHTSGSRISINKETLHLSHGHDRMSPGAQHQIKRQIEAIVDKVTTQTKASL